MIENFDKMPGMTPDIIWCNSDYLLKGNNIRTNRVKSRHDEIVDFLLEKWDNMVFVGKTKAYFQDGFEYTLDTEDLDAEGKPKLVVTGMLGIETKKSDKNIGSDLFKQLFAGQVDEDVTKYKPYKVIVCVADKVGEEAFAIDIKTALSGQLQTRDADGTYYVIHTVNELRMPNLDTMPQSDAFMNQVDITGIVAPKLKKKEKLKNNLHPKTPDDVPIYLKTFDIRPSDKPFTTIEETASLYSIGENRLRAWIKNEPEHPSILWVNTKALIKRKSFEDWLAPLNTFPY